MYSNLHRGEGLQGSVTERRRDTAGTNFWRISVYSVVSDWATKCGTMTDLGHGLFSETYCHAHPRGFALPSALPVIYWRVCGRAAKQKSCGRIWHKFSGSIDSRPKYKSIRFCHIGHVGHVRSPQSVKFWTIYAL